MKLNTLDRPQAYGPFDETFMAEYAEMFYQHTTPQNMVSEAFERSFGLHPTALEDGIAATVEWYGAFLAGAEQAA